MFASLPGVSAPPPFGGNQRTIVVNVDPDRLRAYNVSPEDVVKAPDDRQHHQPLGQRPHQGPDAHRAGQRHGRRTRRTWATFPSGRGRDVYLRDLGTIEDATDIPTGYALVNGSRAVYILVTKRADASTLAVVNEVKKNLPQMQHAIPDDIQRQLRVRPVALRHPGHVGRRHGGPARRRLDRA